MNPRADTLLVAAARAELGGADGLELGVGLVRATATLAAHLARHRPDHVVLVGTAGALPTDRPDPPTIGDALVVTEAMLGSPAAVLDLGYIPLAPGPLTPFAPPGSPRVRALCNLAITTDPALATIFGRECDLENMEVYGVAWACTIAAVPWSAVLGVTNRVGPEAHAQWRANRAEAEAAARHLARRLFFEA